MKATASLKLCLLLAWIIIGTGCKKEISGMDPSGAQMITATINPDEGRSASTDTDTTTDSVYICVSKGAKRYHYDESCRGLKRCTHTIERTTKKKAEAIGLTVCGYEN